MHLRYTITQWDREQRELDYWIQLETTPQPFGGRRWWFVCPRTGRRADKLYLPNGAFTFAARQAYRLAYRSQREAPHDRALRRAFKLRSKLGADGGIGDYVPKPKWMRWPTYDRKLEEISPPRRSSTRTWPPSSGSSTGSSGDESEKKRVFSGGAGGLPPAGPSCALPKPMQPPQPANLPAAQT